MDLDFLLNWVKGLGPVVMYVLAALGSLLVIMSAVVKLTPSQDDDAFLNKVKAIPLLGSLLIALEKFSVVSRKE